MNILHLISSGGYYGAESMMTNLAKSLEKLGHKVTIGLIDNAHRPETDVAEIAIGQGVSLETILCRGRVDLNAIRTIANLVNKLQIEVVHCHGYKADAYALAGRPNRARMVATCHDWFRATGSMRLYQSLDALCLRRFDMTVAVSTEVADALQRIGISKDRITTIANGVNIDSSHTARPTLAGQFRKGDGLMVGMVGQLTRRKGQEYLLRAAPEILAKFPDTMFLFAGEGPARRELEDLTRQLRIDNNVVFLGKRSDMPDVYASLDIFTLPSLNEGMPMVILEALAAGKPVVATPVGDTPKLIRHEETGLLVETQDVAGLRDGLLRLIQEPELRKRFGDNGRALVERTFSSDAMAREYENVYDRICAGRPAA